MRKVIPSPFILVGMQKFICLIILTAIQINILKAQTWDTNTTWVFETDEWEPPIYGNYLIYKITKDTIIAGESYHKIQSFNKDPESGEITHGYIPDFNLQYSNNQIFLYSASDSLRHLVYDFNLEADDSYLAYCDIDPSQFLVHIDSTTVIEHNGTERKVQFVTSEHTGGCYMYGEIIEGMGSVHHILPRYSFVDPPPGGYIVCYNDLSFSYPDDANCQSIVSTTEGKTKGFKVYPNPAKDLLLLELDEAVSNLSYSIINITGSTILRGKVDQKKQIDIHGLSSGLYIITLTLSGLPYAMTKVVINNDY